MRYTTTDLPGLDGALIVGHGRTAYLVSDRLSRADAATVAANLRRFVEVSGPVSVAYLPAVTR